MRIIAYPHHRRCTVKRLRPLRPNRVILEKLIHSGHRREKRRKEKNGKISQCLTPMTCQREQTSYLIKAQTKAGNLDVMGLARRHATRKLPGESLSQKKLRTRQQEQQVASRTCWNVMKCDENVMKYASISNLPSKLSSAGWWVHPRKPHCRVHRQQPPRVLESVANPKKVLSTTSFMAVTSFWQRFRTRLKRGLYKNTSCFSTGMFKLINIKAAETWGGSCTWKQVAPRELTQGRKDMPPEIMMRL